uniref:Putative ovule protein n=1 Tax=Solanum chacoense TaxID=4108 RepID=A0A0V0HYF5_SOLCH
MKILQLLGNKQRHTEYLDKITTSKANSPFTSSATTPFHKKYRLVAIGYPPLQSLPHKKTQYAKRSFTDIGTLHYTLKVTSLCTKKGYNYVKNN